MVSDEKKSIKIGKEETELSLFSCMIVHTELSKVFTAKLVQLIREFFKLWRFNIEHGDYR